MKKKRIVIIGGVAAGASAAGKAARTDKEAEVVIFEKGPYISFANCGLPYYISGEVENRGNLIVRSPGDMKKKYGIDTYVNHEVTEINPSSKTLKVHNLVDGTVKEEHYDKLILTVGGKTFLPPIPGLDAVNLFTLRSIPDIDSIEDYIRQESPKRAAVLGAGYIGLEAADVLRKRGIETSIFEMLPQVLPPLDEDMAKLLEDKITAAGVTVFKGEPVARIEKGISGKAVRVYTKSGKFADVDLVIASLGIRPNLDLAKQAGLEIGKYGVVTDNYMRTSDPDIYAAGDVIEVNHLVTGKPTWSPLAGPANLQGKIAGANAAGENERYRGVLRSSIVEFDGMAAAKTGISEKEAKEDNIDYFAVQIRSSSHAGYYPGSKPMHIKALFKKRTGHLLGAQAVGEEGIDKRIDVFATALMAKMTAEDLVHLDLAYSPQFSNSLDAVNVIGSIAVGKMEKN